MNADCFIFSEEPFYQNSIINLFGYSYIELKKDRKNNKYSRKELRQKHIYLKGDSGRKTKLELEDYLRNDLVTNYVEKYKVQFNLKYFHFVGGADEIKDGVTIGNLDIKVLFPSGILKTEKEYLAIECKRINKLLKRKKYYIDHGVNRFIERKYYPDNKSSVAWMLSFMECELESQKESPGEIVNSFNQLLDANYSSNVVKKIGEVDVEYTVDYTMDIYNSLVNRIDNSNLQILHIFFNYYDLIDP